MKKTIRSIALICLSLLIALTCTALSACREPTPTEQLWEGALYLEDTELGAGEKCIYVKVIAGERSVNLTVRTDRETLADALMEHGLVEGDMDTYGLYIKKVNGILADYDVDLHYWKLSEGEKALMTGASQVMIADGVQYVFERAK